jgi:hypothetical protein
MKKILSFTLVLAAGGAPIFTSPQDAPPHSPGGIETGGENKSTFLKDPSEMSRFINKSSFL